MITYIKAKYHGLAAVLARGGPTVFARQFNEWIQNSYKVALLHWHREMRPKHFQESAIAEYGYQPRKADYTESKRQSEGHARPLVYSGESERETERFTIRTTSKEGRLTMPAGNLAWMPKGRKISMREELTTVTDAEKQELANLIDVDMHRQIRGLSSTLTKQL